MKYIFDLRSIPKEKLPLSGGKASSLSLMMNGLKMDIPSGYVITADGFRDGIISEDAAKKLATSRMYNFDQDTKNGVSVGKNKFLAAFHKEALAKLIIRHQIHALHYAMNMVKRNLIKAPG